MEVRVMKEEDKEIGESEGSGVSSSVNNQQGTIEITGGMEGFKYFYSAFLHQKY